MGRFVLAFCGREPAVLGLTERVDLRKLVEAGLGVNLQETLSL